MFLVENEVTIRSIKAEIGGVIMRKGMLKLSLECLAICIMQPIHGAGKKFRKIGDGPGDMGISLEGYFPNGG